MKKNILLSIIVLLGILATTGCKKENVTPVVPGDLFCITALEDGLQVSMNVFDEDDPHVNPSLLYSLNGTDWTPFEVGKTVVTLSHSGDRMYMKANETNTTFCTLADSNVEYLYNCHTFRFSKKTKVSGNIMYLLNGENPDKAVMGDCAFCCLFYKDSLLQDVSELLLPATRLSLLCYSEMFENTSITKAPVLPATQLAPDCYASMFIGCRQMTVAPELPATRLAMSCYNAMFCECTQLRTAPLLPATQLDTGCYANMFSGCTALVRAPRLPATQLAYICYCYMFKGCTSITECPDLPAETLVEGCYQGMFKDCTSLNRLTCKATDNGAADCVKGWMKGITTNGTLRAAQGCDWEGKIPETWTVEY